jgi:hypothetical protein
MAYSGGKLPYETASKLGHLNVVQSEWVRSLIKDFETSKTELDIDSTMWTEFEDEHIKPLRNIWAVDGSYVKVASDNFPPREVAFVKTALMALDKSRIDKVDKKYPHPLILQDIMADSGIFHATVFPLKNIRTKDGSNYTKVRHIVRDSIKIDSDGSFYETLKWLAYMKWDPNQKNPSPSFSCPLCHKEIPGLSYDLDEDQCPECNGTVFLTDMIGFHLDMSEDSAPESIASAYMSIMEHLMLFTAIRLSWHHTDKKLLNESLFIKDGPLTLRGQYSKLVPNIRAFLEYAKKQGRPIHIIGQEKNGVFVDHLSTLARFVSPKVKGEKLNYAILSHDYIRREVYRAPELTTPYGKKTNWGEKVYVKLDPKTYIVLNVPTGEYSEDGAFPNNINDLIGFERILATLPGLISHKHEGALFPIGLANAIASMSSYPSAKILQRFFEEYN